MARKQHPKLTEDALKHGQKLRPGRENPRQRITRRRWTPEEDAYVIAHYGKVKYQLIAEALGRTYESVRSRAQVAGIANANEQLRRGENASLHLVQPAVLPDDGWVEPRPYLSVSAPKLATMIRNSKIAVAVHLRHGQPKAAAAISEDIAGMKRELEARRYAKVHGKKADIEGAPS